jgi:hypothetical protein
MSDERAPTAARIATLWVRVYTHAAPEDDRQDRRDEVSADLHDEIADACRRQVAARALTTSIARRMVRGVASDLAWRVDIERQPGRAEWHLAHPGTLLAATFAALVPLGLVTDAGRSRVPQLADVAQVSGAAATALAAFAVGFGLVAAGRRARRPSARSQPRDSRVAAVRRSTLSCMSVLWALALLWRLAPGPLGDVSTFAWAAFGVALLVYAATVLIAGAQKVLDLGKVSS